MTWWPRSLLRRLIKRTAIHDHPGDDVPIIYDLTVRRRTPSSIMTYEIHFHVIVWHNTWALKVRSFVYRGSHVPSNERSAIQCPTTDHSFHTLMSVDRAEGEESFFLLPLKSFTLLLYSRKSFVRDGCPVKKIKKKSETNGSEVIQNFDIQDFIKRVFSRFLTTSSCKMCPTFQNWSSSS